MTLCKSRILESWIPRPLLPRWAFSFCILKIQEQYNAKPIAAVGASQFGQGRFGQSWKNHKSDRFGQFFGLPQKQVTVFILKDGIVYFS